MGQNDMIFVSQDGNFKEEHNEKLLDLWVEQTRHSPTRISKHIANLKKTAQKHQLSPSSLFTLLGGATPLIFMGYVSSVLEGPISQLMEVKI